MLLTVKRRCRKGTLNANTNNKSETDTAAADAAAATFNVHANNKFKTDAAAAATDLTFDDNNGSLSTRSEEYYY